MSASFNNITRSRTQSCPEGLLIKDSKKYGRHVDDLFFKERVCKSSVTVLSSAFAENVIFGDQQDLNAQDESSYLFFKTISSNQGFFSSPGIASPQDFLEIATHDHRVRAKKVAQEMARLDQGSPRYNNDLEQLRRKAYQGLEAQRYEDVLLKVRERSSTA